MRIFPNFIKTTLKEDRDYYRALLDALNAGPTQNQWRILSLVKHHHLDHNRDLTSELYHSFLNALSDLDVVPPSVQINAHNKEAGSWYPIPGRGKLHKGKTHDQCLATRSTARRQRWDQLVEASGYAAGELDILLAIEDTQIAELRQTVIEVTNDLEQKVESKLRDLEAVFCEMLEQIDQRVTLLEQG